MEFEKKTNITFETFTFLSFVWDFRFDSSVNECAKRGALNNLVVSWDGVQVSKKTLIMREINEESVQSLLERRDALASCDVAAFVYDRSEPLAWYWECL